ncbi:hypothetical protein GZH49_29330 [Nocardia terpenica]|uniref:hypothetical protein n=1 Tax=Nocardia terpenica TaxID=455432 RepID=UPI002FE29A84
MTDTTAYPRPEIPKVRFLGRSWYKRGLAYWLKRARYSIVFIGISVFPVVFVAAFFSVVIDEARSWIRVALVIAGCLAICWSVYTGSRAVARSIREENLLLDEQSAPIAPRSTRKAGTRAGLGLGVAASSGSPLAGGFVAVGQLFVVGWLAAFFVKSFRRYLSAEEISAVVAMRSWYKQHSEIPHDQRPRQFRQ